MTATVLKLMQETDGQSVLMVSHGAAMANFARAWQKNWRLDLVCRPNTCRDFKVYF